MKVHPLQQPKHEAYNIPLLENGMQYGYDLLGKAVCANLLMDYINENDKGKKKKLRNWILTGNFELYSGISAEVAIEQADKIKGKIKMGKGISRSTKWKGDKNNGL